MLKVWKRSCCAMLLAGAVGFGGVSFSAGSAFAWQDEEAAGGTDALRGSVVQEEAGQDEADVAAQKLTDELQKMRDELRREIAGLKSQLQQSEFELHERRLQGVLEPLSGELQEGQPLLNDVLLGGELPLKELNELMHLHAQNWWIGVHCARLGDGDKERLGWDEEGSGLLIETVVEESPAAGAGLRGGDVITAIGGESVDGVSSLVKAVNEAEGKALSLEIWREGETLTIEVTPGKRPGDYRVVPAAEVFEEMRMGVGTGLELPADFSMTFRKAGNQPAEIEVTWGDKEYSATSDELGELPGEVRELVERAMSIGRGGAKVFFTPSMDLQKVIPNGLDLGIEWHEFQGGLPDMPEGIEIDPEALRGLGGALQVLPEEREELHRWFSERREEIQREANGEVERDAEMEEVKGELKALRSMLEELLKEKKE